MHHPAAPSSDRTPLRRLGRRLLDLLYPAACAVCRQTTSDGRLLCPGCDAQLPRLRRPFCDCCGEHFDGAIDGRFDCPNCGKLEFSFQFARPAMLRDLRLRELIHRLKYGREIHLAVELGRLAREALADPRFETPLLDQWPLVPVPLHRSRLRFRHFNQAAEIALQVAALSGLPMVAALDRVRPTTTQTSLTRAERLANLRGAFALSRAGRALAADPPAGVILVDDVLTTGSTVDACAKALVRAGIRRVAVITVMRG
jgi:competence protein ComFC